MKEGDLVRAIRRARPSDLSILSELETCCWPADLRVSGQVIERRLARHPAGQFVIESEGRVCGVLYSQRIASVDELKGARFDQADELHRSDGAIVHVLSLNIHPDMQSMAFGDALLEHVLAHCHESGTVDIVVGVTRCKDYSRHAGMGLEEYIQTKNARGRCLDTVLRLHQRHGAVVKGLVPGYRPSDGGTLGHGVLVEYELRSRSERVARYQRDAASAPLDIPAMSELQTWLLGWVDGVAGRAQGDRPAEGLLHRPLFELGLDSGDLVDLQERIQDEYGAELPPLFFFEYDTLSKVMAYLDGLRSVAGGAAHREERSMPGPSERDATADIAIVGMACRLPGGIERHEDLWGLLQDGGCVVGRLPKDRWQWPEGFRVEEHAGVDCGAFVADMDRFDAALFRISPYEAQRMDPQQRWMLELTWACLEDAGCAPKSVAGASVGVFVGASGSDYQRLMDSAGMAVEGHSGLGTSMAIIANRISYFYDLQGPSMQLDTACSSSLVAVHAAVRALRAGDCQAALVGGVNVMCHPATSMAYHRAGMLSREGRCKTFDASANGYVRSEGGIVMLLKSVSRALEDRDRIYAVIKGSAVNHGGQAGGLTVPNAKMQADLVSKALADAGVEPRAVSYVEAHGTGTPLGDPIEVQGLTKVFAGSATACGLGSIKPNVGHLEAAAGLAGLLKVVLAMRHRRLPANIHYERLNPKIALEGSPFYIVDRSAAWEPVDGMPRVAGVSSFGSGGSNAHVIVQEFAPPMGWEPRDMDAPAYRFARERHWISKEENEALEPLTMLVPVWDVVSPTLAELGSEGATQALLIIGGTSEQQQQIRRKYPAAKFLFAEPATSIDALVRGLTEVGPLEHIVWIAPPGPRDGHARDIVDEQEQGVLHLFRVVKALLALGYGARGLAWTIVTAQTQRVRPFDVVDACHAGVHGLVGSMSKEYPRWNVRLLDLEADAPLPVHEMFDLPFQPQGNALAHRGGEWYAAALLPLRASEPEAHHPAAPYKAGGVYVVIGGAGGIGEAWSKRLIETWKARIIWLGRRDEAAVRDKIEALSAYGPAPTYIQCDARDPVALEEAYRRIQCDFSRIDGVVHSALDLFDKALSDTDEARLKAILSVNVDVSVHAARVFGEEPLDFFLFFSSVEAFVKSGGYCGYSAGCAFKDAFALQLRSERRHPVKVMNWGYWRVGAGDRISAQTKARNELRGMGTIEPDEGLDALDPLFEGPFDQLAVIRASKADAMPGVATDESLVLHAKTSWSVLPEAMSSYPLERVDVVVSAVREPSREFDALCIRWLWSTLRGMGLFGAGGFTVASLEQGGVYLPFYRRWMRETLGTLCAQGFLEQDGERIRPVRDAAPIEGVRREWARSKDAWQANAYVRARMTLVEACMAALPAVLSGKRPATEILFPRSSMDLVGDVYRGNEVSDLFNDILAEALAACIADRLAAEPERAVRILEIGAGTGGTTAAVLRKLQPYRERISEYGFTDISRSFLFHAQEHYAPGNAFVRTELFDVEKPLAGQRIDAGAYDFVLATNVLHATKNIRRTLRHAKACLRRGGVLLLNELSEKTLFTHVTFGLLEGWWLTQDEKLRIAGSPLLHPEAWGRVLHEEGFGPVHFPVAAAHVLGQCVIAGKSDGLVRLAGAAKTEAEAAVVPSVDVPRASRGPTQEMLREKATRYFKQIIARTLRMESRNIDASAPLESYGIDSILVVQINDRLRDAFGDVGSTLLFEMQTLDALVSHFIDTRRDELVAVLGIRDDRAVPPPPVPRESVRVEKASDGAREPIAIIGMSGRYPMANQLDDYWENLKSGRDCISEVPEERWPLGGFYHPNKEEAVARGVSYAKWGGFLEGHTEFDSLFFQISPREAASMDPQERLLLQSCWELMEDAGYTRARLARQHGGNVGVFVGITRTGFDLFGPELWKQGETTYPHTSFASVANRVSYVLNLHGPSMAIDTMCSSSLTALHEACENLQHDVCEMAIAGGVNVYVHPSSYVLLCSQLMLSVDGRCRAFGKGGNGFVPGEGVGVVLLKKLSRALADNDRIHALVRGTHANHGGKANGYTVPNPKVQGDLVRGALEKARVDARSVSYVEAHGTGTELGDPIEIRGLSQAFETHTQDRGFCAIGSVKSNIGHLESAAGIAGVTKVVLQMKHETLVPSLHADELNPNIDFAATPFVVHSGLRPWPRPIIGGKEIPRIAGVSSFGAGGSNAHVLLEEYVSEGGDLPEPADDGPCAIVLSAANAERLRVYAERLLAFVEAPAQARMHLADLAYTLQIGREAMEERLAAICHSVADLAAKLRAFLDGKSDVEDLWIGQVKRNRESLEVFTVDEELQEAIAKWMARGKLSRLSSLWVKGGPVDWSELPRAHTPRRPRMMSAPTYPFARPRHELPVGESMGRQEDALHPLLHRNTSSFGRQRFSSTFTGQEFFLREHLVKGEPVLPGVAHLEMAQQAVRRAFGDAFDGARCIQLENVVWVRPIRVSGRKEIHIALDPREGGAVDFAIYSANEEAGSEPVVHSQGVARLVPRDAMERHGNSDGPSLSELQRRLARNGDSPHRYYEFFEGVGIVHGPSYRGLASIYVGEGNESLAQLALPASVGGTDSDYGLHPSMMDSALQEVQYRVFGGDGTRAPLPFAMQSVVVLRACTAAMWAWVRPSPNAAGGAERVRKFDIDLYDANGEPCVRMRGFSSRILEGTVESRSDGTVLFEEVWMDAPASVSHAQRDEDHRIVLCGFDSATCDEVGRRWSVRAFPGDAGFEACAIGLLDVLQDMLRAPPSRSGFVQVVVRGEGPGALLTGLSGLLRTAHLEHPRLRGQVIVLEGANSVSEIAAKLEEGRVRADDELVRYRGDQRQAAAFERIVSSDVEVPWRDGGVYLVTGGAGGLGLIFAREMAERTKGATVILTGRSQPGARFDELARLGARIVHRRSDVSDGDAVDALVRGIVEEYGRLNGVIHSAGILRDRFVSAKSPADVAHVLAPKVSGVVNLDRATKALDLDFFVVFSSVAAAVGNVGQADYAAANGFLDAFARYRHSLVSAGQRRGRSVSMAWPLWKDAGMGMDEATQTMVRESLGMTPMDTPAGLDAFYRALASGRSHVVVMHGMVERIERRFLRAPAPPPPPPQPVLRVASESSRQSVLRTAAKVLKLNVDAIELDVEFSHYGADSILLTELANRLNREYGLNLVPTVFFEYPTMGGFIDFIVDHHGAAFASIQEAAPVAAAPVREVVAVEREFVRHPRAAITEREPVAVIGLSGRFPMALDLDAFWGNLEAGRDCISEIPVSRWDWRDCYGDAKTEINKSSVKWGGFIEGVREFDPLFFGISPREAASMDPHQRLVMTYVWSAMEDAGYSSKSLSGTSTGIFVAIMNSGYDGLIQRANVPIEGYSATATVPSMGPNRISYFLDVHGPSEPVDTACSSSLVAIHRAMVAMEVGDCDQAIVGGVNTMITPEFHISFDRAGMLSPDGRCKTFSKDANGYARGEGVCMLFLKKLGAAERDGDHIYGLILSSELNHGGRANSFTAPNPNAQADLLVKAYEKAGIDPRTVGYIETHGTGTPLGDPIEINGLKKAFATLYREGPPVSGPHCGLGSVKTNIGHLEMASGAAGVAKVLMQLRHRRLVKTLHCEEVNPYIDLAGSPFYLVRDSRPWEAVRDALGRALPRRAGVSSFGIGGVNAHVVLEEYIARDAAVDDGALIDVVVPLSAKSENRLREYAAQLLHFVQKEEQKNEQTANRAGSLRSLAYTLQVGRDEMPERLALVVSTLGELAEKLRGFVNQVEGISGVYRGQAGKHARRIEGSRPAEIAERWVMGDTLDWRELHGDRRPRRMSLPTYPFERETIWVPAKKEAPPLPLAHEGRRFLSKAWTEASLAASTATHRRMVIFHDDTTEALARALASFDARALRISDAGASLDALGGEIGAWVDLTGISGASFPRASIALLQRVLARKPHEGRPSLLVYVTRGLEAHRNARPVLEGASGAGLYRALGSEYGSVGSRHIDLDPEPGDVRAEAALLYAEMAAECGDVEICYRGNVRYAAELKEGELGAPVPKVTFSPHEVLLVTGGTRGLGLLCARHFVAHYGVRRLVLTGREVLPPKSSWGQMETYPASVRDKIRAVQSLEAQGIEVRVLAIPLVDVAEVRAQMADVASSMGPIAGIVHAAGIVDMENPAFVRKTLEGMWKVAAPKIEGTQNLLQSVDAGALKVVLLFSSVASAIPTLGAGQSDYAMANAFMDAYARVHGASLPITSLQWPSWRETGLGEAKSPAYVRSGLLSLSDAEGLALLDQVLSHRAPPVILPALVDAARFEAPKAVAPAPAPRSPGLMAFLKEVFETELGLAPGRLDEGTSYADYGADSILLAQILEKIKRKLGTPLDPSTLFEHATLHDLSAWLMSAHAPAVTAQFGLEASLPRAIALPAPPEAPASLPRTPSTARNWDAVAVIGMACRLPGSPDIDAYWQLLCRGESALRKVPEDCWGMSTNYYAGLVDDIYGFDPRFFLIHEEDVRAMDPQALVLLEESLKAFCHAGYSVKDVGGSNTGVYVGARSRREADTLLVEQARNPTMTIGQNYLAANLSRFFDLQGPAMVLDTACSSSLTAMNVAADALRAGAIEMALVAGISLLTGPEAHEMFGRRKLLQERGEFHILDRRASGIVLGEGAGVVLLKPLSLAERDGNTIYAVIEGIAINNDGRTAGPATPNMKAQERVMQSALDAAGCRPDQIAYLDVNGSGSEVTDLLEIKAIEAVYGGERASALHLGSMKPNIGHPLSAEAMASFIKVALMVHHQRLVPFLSGQQQLEHYPMEAKNFAFPREDRAHGLPYAALNCFADGGTNGHVIVKRYEAGDVAAPTRTPQAWPEMHRVDVRTMEALPAADGGVLAHRFGRSKAWTKSIDAGHAILRNHRAYGQRLLPGLAWIDVLYQWFGEIGWPVDELALNNLSIYRPLGVDDASRVELRIEARADGPGRWRVQVSDAAPDSTFVTAEMHRREKTRFDERVDIEAVKRASRDIRDFEDFYRHYRSQELVHTGIMKANGTLYAGADELWLDVSLAEGEETGDHLFHPALIDGSAVGAGGATADRLSGESRLFLPLFYESFSASRPIDRACYTRIRLASVELHEELLSMTMEFFGLDGTKIGELRNFKNKLVRNAGLINPNRQERPAGRRALVERAPEASTEAPSFDSGLALVTSLIAAQMGVAASTIQPGAGYYELGLDSPMLLDVVKRIEASLGVRLSPTLLFEHTTVGALGEHLQRTYPIGKNDQASPSSQAAKGSKPARARRSQDRKTTHAPLRTEHSVRTVKKESTDVAIIGMAGRYPKARNLREFWDNLEAGTDCITEVPESRWPRTHFDGVLSRTGRPMSRWGGFIDDADCFDAGFFSIPAAEAEHIDPQERLFLEICWEAMEDAGYTPDNLLEGEGNNLRRAVGVYVGVMHKDYTLVQDDAVDRGGVFPLSLNYSQIANRVSYYCNFHGPSMAIDAVCSSSLTAVHLAVESIRAGECRRALAGGVNLSLHPAKYQTYGVLDMHSSDGHCRSFGDGGDGYVSAEGIGAVLLKPLEQAIEDGDAIYAVIKASTINHVGRSGGLSIPSPLAHEALITDCLSKSGIDPETIGYIEAHGTGTVLGDLIEFQGLNRAFRNFTEKNQFCALGSIKSNMGHAESAAGISALTKAVLQLHHKALVGLLHAEKVNPYIELEASPFFLQKEFRPWDLNDAPTRRAGVSAFGAAGSNAHVILEEAPPVPARGDERIGPVLLTLSAKDDERLRAYAQRMLEFLEVHDDVDLASMAYTLQVGRMAFEERVVLLARNVQEARELLKQFTLGSAPANVWRRRVSEGGSKLLDEDDVVADLVRRWASRGRWEKLAELWLSGHAIDWRVLYEELPRRMHLPTYPFAKDRHWVSLSVDGERPAPEPPKLPPVPPVPSESEAVFEWQFSFDGGGQSAGAELNAEEKARLFLRSLVASHLEVPLDGVDLRKGLLDMGLDSVGIVALTQAIASSVDPGFLPSKLFEHGSVAELAAYLVRTCPEALARMSIRKVEKHARRDETSDPAVLEVLERLEGGGMSLDEAAAQLEHLVNVTHRTHLN